MSNQPTDEAPRRFLGFRSPNYTMVPDELFDELLPVLSGGELKVLLYIIRRTFGFKRDSDTISINQMLNGIKTREGRVLDRGVGLTKKTLLAAIRSLEERNVILTERRRSLERGDEATSYQLNIADSTRGGKSTPPVGEKVHQGGGGKSTPGPRGKNSPTQYTVEQETVGQETDNFENSNIRKVSSLQKGDSRTSERPPERTQSNAPVRGTESVGAVLQRRPQRSRPRPETETEEWQAIQAYIEDFARQLGDSAPIKSSTTRAYNLYLASGLPLEAFLGKLFQSRSLTQESSARITKTAVDPEYKVNRKTKMAYFFAVLEDQLGLAKKKPPSASGDAGAGGQPRNAAPQKPPSEPVRRRDSDDPYADYIEH